MEMKIAWTLILGLGLLGAGCSKNDNPTGPSDPGTPVLLKIYVNPSNGSDGNAGTESAPFRTIRKALGVAYSGQRVELQAGTYDAAADQAYPDTIPNGVTVEAVSAGLAVLVGTGQVAFVASGNDTILYLSFRGFQTIFQSASGDHVAKSLIAVDVGYAFDLSRSAQAEATGCSLTNSGAASLTDIAQLSLNASTISGPPPNNFFFLVQKAATLQIDGTKMSDGNSTALALTDVSVTTLSGCTLSKMSRQGSASSSAIDLSVSAQLTLQSTTISGGYGPAVFMRDAGTHVTASVCTFTGNGSGTGSSEFLQQGGVLDIDSCSISGAAVSGFYVSNASLNLRNSTVQGMGGAGINAITGSRLYMRNTSISSCQYGLLLTGSSATADLGTSTSAGGNTIVNNAQFGIMISHTGEFFAYTYGNTWIPNLQGANANGHYGSFLAVGPVQLTAPMNYYIDSNVNYIQF